jgi:hypothetical protein
VALTDFVAATSTPAAPAGGADVRPDTGRKEDREEACLDRLIARSATPGEMKQVQQRKMKVHQLGMHPQQIQQLWEVIDKHPVQAAAMFGPDASMEALRNEIGGEKRKLDFQISAHGELERLETLSPKAKVDHDRARWHAWLLTYFARLALDQPQQQQQQPQPQPQPQIQQQRRLQGMRDSNPTFVLRNWVAQDAIEAAETGDYSKVQQLHCGWLSSPSSFLLLWFWTNLLLAYCLSLTTHLLTVVPCTCVVFHFDARAGPSIIAHATHPHCTRLQYVPCDSIAVLVAVIRS